MKPLHFTYQYKDHTSTKLSTGLGNNRLSYADANGNGKIDTPGSTAVTLWEETFEDKSKGNNDWDGSGNSWGWPITDIVSNKAKSGSKSGMLQNTAGTHREIACHSNEWVPINIDKPTLFRYSGWVFIENGAWSADIFLFMKTASEKGYESGLDHINIWNRNKWVYVEKTALVPANITRLNLRIDNNGTGNAKVWFDDLKIEQLDMSQNEIVSETNYYPFGLEHKGYNEHVNSTNLGENWKYQGQERTPEMDLNIDEWKYRVSDPAIGRFWQIDPLAEDYYYNSTYAFQENKLGMGIELEGAELLGFNKAQKIIHRASEFKSGVNKVASGGASLISKSINQSTPTNNTPIPNYDNNTIISNPDFQTMGEGASKIVNTLPNKQDARNLADGAELTGDALVVSAPFAGPLAPEVAAVGGIISTVGFTANLALDLAEGDLEAAATRASIELASMGMGSMVKNAGGDRVAEELTNTVMNRTGEAIQKTITEEEIKKY